MKDRGAILPAGLLADGAYWFNSESGKWESSRYYEKQDPFWLEKFNSVDFFEKYISRGWDLAPSLKGFELNTVLGDLIKEDDSTFIFKHNLDTLFKYKKWAVLKSIPNGNQMTLDISKELIKAEELGQNYFIDFLSISFSATDYIGHKYGVESAEIMDAYVKLDSILSDLLSFLDNQVGEDDYLLFLTSDHGAGFSREYLKETGQVSGFLNTKAIKNHLDSCLDERFGQESWIESFINLNFYFSDEVKSKYDSTFDEVLVYSAKCLSNAEGILKTWSPFGNELDTSYMGQLTKNAYFKSRSGELILIEKYGWTTYYDKGSTHGSPYEYDTHVPLLFYGNGIRVEASNTAYSIIDIAPSVMKLLGLPFPKQSVGTVIEELVH